MDPMTEIIQRLDRIEKLLLARPTATIAATGGGVAADSELSGQYGDPEIRTNLSTKRWAGPQHKGERMSTVKDAGYLMELASHLEWAATKDDEVGDEQHKKYAAYKRMDARRARAYAARLTHLVTVSDQIPF